MALEYSSIISESIHSTYNKSIIDYARNSNLENDILNTPVNNLSPVLPNKHFVFNSNHIHYLQFLICKNVNFFKYSFRTHNQMHSPNLILGLVKSDPLF